jgi:hypothetical protein
MFIAGMCEQGQAKPEQERNYTDVVGEFCPLLKPHFPVGCMFRKLDSQDESNRRDSPRDNRFARQQEMSSIAAHGDDDNVGKAEPSQQRRRHLAN